MKHNFRQRVINEYGLPVVKVESVNCELGSGILDKNGVEIFEGDIVIFGEHELKGTVIFRDAMFQIAYGSDNGKELFSILGRCRDFVDVEIVGHIAQD